MVSILKIDLRRYIIGFPNPASRHYFFFLPAIPLASNVSSRSRYQNSFLSRQTHFFSGWTRFLRVRVSTTIRSLLTIRLRQSVQFVKFFLFWVSFSQSKKVFFSGEQRMDHDKGPQSHQTRNHKQLCLESVSMPRFIQISLHKTFQTQEVVRFSHSFITVFEYILQSPLQHCADLALVMNINMLIVHINTTHARNSCCRRETF